MRLSADLGDRMRPPESVIVRWRRATPGSCPRPRGSGPGRDVQRSPRRPCRRGAAETDSKTCLLPCAVRRSAARCSVMSSTTAPTPITASGSASATGMASSARPEGRTSRMWRPTCSAAPMPSSAASAWLTSTNRRCRSTIASPTRAAACTSIRMFPVPAVLLSHGSPRASVLLDTAARQVDAYAATSRYAPFIPPHRAQA